MGGPGVLLAPMRSSAPPGTLPALGQEELRWGHPCSHPSSPYFPLISCLQAFSPSGIFDRECRMCPAVLEGLAVGQLKVGDSCHPSAIA